MRQLFDSCLFFLIHKILYIKILQSAIVGFQCFHIKSQSRIDNVIFEIINSANLIIYSSQKHKYLFGLILYLHKHQIHITH